MAKHLSKDENQIHTMGTLLAAGEDKSWKVRLAFAKNFAELANAFGSELTDNNLIQTFTLLLNDQEAEVKQAAITSLRTCLKQLSVEKICSLILPTLTNAYAESTQAFKCGTSSALCEMSTLVGKDFSSQKIMPVLTELIKDENSDVRLSVVEGLLKIASVIGAEIFTAPFIAQLTQLTKDAQWRVRMVVFELIGDLAKIFGKEIF